MIGEALARLQERREDVRAVLLAGFDGIVVEASGDGWSVPPDEMAAAFSDLFKKVRAAHRELGLAAPTEFAATSAHGRVLIREVTDEYLLLAVLAERGLAGRARFEIAKAATAIQHELL